MARTCGNCGRPNENLKKVKSADDQGVGSIEVCPQCFDAHESCVSVAVGDPTAFYCQNCGFTGDEDDFVSTRVANLMICPQCGLSSEIFAKERGE